MGLFWQEYWSGLPFLPPGDLPDLGIEPVSPKSPTFHQVGFLSAEPPEKLHYNNKKWESHMFTVRAHSVLVLSTLIAAICSFPGGTSGKEPACQCRRHKRYRFHLPPGGGHGNPLQCSCLENPMDRGAWWATVHRVAKSRTQLERLSTQHIYILRF